MLSVLGGLGWQPAYAESVRDQLAATTPFYSFLLPNTNTLKFPPPHFNFRTCFKTYCKKSEQQQVSNNNTPFSQGFSALKEECSPLESENLWSTLALYLFTLHIPFSFGGLSVVALLTGQSVLDPQTEALSLLVIQILELSGALVLFKYTAKPQYKFTNFFKNNKLLNDRNWIVASVLGFGFLVFLIFLTSLLADRLFGSKSVNPILKGILLYSDISRVSCVLVYCIVTPLLEEVVYRGFLLTSLSSTMEWQQAVAVSSIIFSAIHFSVKHQWRRQGHGEALLKAAIEKCRTRKVSRILLHVNPLRIAALNLFKKHGFQVDTLVEGYYSLDLNAYRMYLDFDDSN